MPNDPSTSSAATSQFQSPSKYEPSATAAVLSPSLSANADLKPLKPNSILLLNSQGFNPSAESCQRWKLKFLLNIVQSSEFNHPIIALTETWLKPCITDAQIQLESYNVFRGDRISRGRGGTLLYIKEDLAVTVHKNYDDGICQAVFCLSPPCKLMILCAYKPPDTPYRSFSNLLAFLSKCIADSKDCYNYTIVVLGDFNFPGVWSTTTEDIPSFRSTEERHLINFMNCHFLSQYVNVPTRDENILDICLTNNDQFVYKAESDKTILSDHNVIKLLLSAGELALAKSSSISSTPSKEITGFQSLNLFEADYTSICEELSKLDWESIWQGSNLEDFPKLLHDIVLKSY